MNNLRVRFGIISISIPPHRHDGKLVRLWYDFPPFDGSHDKDHETEVLLEASAIFESFLTSTPEKPPNMEYLEKKP